MADKRKLLAEVDRTLKKVQEGMDIFDEIWGKVQEAPTQALKEKYEQDLKKEIKKLQRLRDQIKTWIASNNDIKDKEPLLKARRDIESKMEKFKDVERETKTKVYSKVGLSQAAKLDVNQKKKNDARNILTGFIDRLNCDLEQFESEREDLELGARKKKLEKDKLEKVDFLKNIMESHRTHITKLETILRMLDNDCLEPDVITGFEDDIAFYVDQAENGKLEDIHFIYETIDLDETIPDSPSESPEPLPNKEPDEPKKKKPAEEPAKVTPKIPVPVNPVRASESVVTGKSLDAKSLPSALPVKPSQPSHPPIPQPLPQPYAAAAAKAIPQAQPPKVQPSNSVPSSAILPEESEAKKTEREKTPEANSVTTNNEIRRASMDIAAKSSNSQLPVSASPKPVNSSYASSVGSAPSTPHATPVKDPWKDGSKSFLIKSAGSQPNGPLKTEQPTFTVQPVPSAASSASSATLETQQTKTNDDPSRAASSGPFSTAPPPIEAQVKTAAQNNPFVFPAAKPASEEPVVNDSPVAVPQLPSTSPASSHRSSVLLGESTTSSVTPQTQTQLITRVELASKIPPNVAVVSLGAERPTRDLGMQGMLLDAAFSFPPRPCDSERRKPFIPCVQCQVPTTWPRSPPQQLLYDMKFYNSLTPDTLFFIFYYQEGSMAQLLAARTLKSKNWRYHKQLNAWFQRLEEPKVKNNDYERGNYKYWDIDTWSEKQKNDFTFEYRYLEQIDLSRMPYV